MPSGLNDTFVPGKQGPIWSAFLGRPAGCHQPCIKGPQCTLCVVCSVRKKPLLRLLPNCQSQHPPCRPWLHCLSPARTHNRPQCGDCCTASSGRPTHASLITPASPHPASERPPCTTSVLQSGTIVARLGLQLCAADSGAGAWRQCSGGVALCPVHACSSWNGGVTAGPSKDSCCHVTWLHSLLWCCRADICSITRPPPNQAAVRCCRRSLPCLGKEGRHLQLAGCVHGTRRLSWPGQFCSCWGRLLRPLKAKSAGRLQSRWCSRY